MNATAAETPTTQRNVNTRIVNALLSLRSLTIDALCSVTGISPGAMRGWLSGEAMDEDERLSFERQLEVLKVLGIVGKHPRADITHHWTIREPMTGDRQAAYEPLDLMLRCFGRAELVHLTPDRDRWASLAARTYFGLTFEKFRVMLEIQTSPFQTLSFEPGRFVNLFWAGAGAALVLEESKFRQLTAPGESTPAAFDRERVQALEYLHWNKLTELAAERGLGAPALAVLLIETVPAIGHTPVKPRPAKGRNGAAAEPAETPAEVSAPAPPPAAADAAPSASQTAAPAAAPRRTRARKARHADPAAAAFVRTADAPGSPSHSAPPSGN